jgi:HEPN domain-containing protein
MLFFNLNDRSAAPDGCVESPFKYNVHLNNQVRRFSHLAHHVFEDRIKEKFNTLETEGRNMLSSSGYDGRQYNRNPPTGDYVRFRTEVMNLIEKVCGQASSHYQAIKHLAESPQSTHNSYYYAACFGALQAAQRDFNDGMLSNIKLLVRADLIDDFLSQAEALLEQGFHIPAASLAGAVLEDSLRKLCDKHSVAYAAKTKIDTLNSDLARVEVYDKLIQKEITAKADLRNNADHGHFAKVRTEDVADMVRWIRRFVTQMLN